MSSAALAWNIAPPISTLDPNTLIAPFDETVLEGGFLRVGQKTLRRGRELGITATEDMVRLKIEAHRYTKERLPYLSISFISGLIGKSYSTTQRYIKRLRQKGFLHVYTKDWALAGAMPNGLSCYFYDFSPFYAQLQALEQEVGPENAEERAYCARLAEARHKHRILQEQAERRSQQVEASKERSRLHVLETQRRLLLTQEKCKVAQLEAQLAQVTVVTLEAQASTRDFQKGSSPQNPLRIALLHSDVNAKVPGIEEDRNARCLEKKRDSDSSGVAAGFEEEEGGLLAIRNVEPLAFPLPNISPSLSPRISKPSSVLKETGGAMHVEAAKTSVTEEKLSKWQVLALAHGVSLTQQDALDSYIKNCPRPMHIPMRVEESIDPLSRRFNNAQYLTSNRTQATKLWQYARLRGMDHEYLHDTFQVWVNAAAAVSVPSFIQNKMAWFFKALHLEVLKALLPYECIAPVAEVQREGEQETSPHDAEVFTQEYDVSSASASDEQGEQETSPHNVVRTLPNEEQECQEQPEPEPEYLMTNDPDAGWATWASAAHFAARLHEWVGKVEYRVDVLPTRFGRYGFSLYEPRQPKRVLEYVTASQVAARIEEEKQRLNPVL